MIQGNQADSLSAAILPAAILTSALLKGAQLWINAQGEVLSAMDAVMGGWMRRRQRAFDTWSQSVKKMGSFEFRMGDVAPGERLGASAWS